MVTARSADGSSYGNTLSGLAGAFSTAAVVGYAGSEPGLNYIFGGLMGVGALAAGWFARKEFNGTAAFMSSLLVAYFMTGAIREAAMEEAVENLPAAAAPEIPGR